jgi:hypothetical protein
LDLAAVNDWIALSKTQSLQASTENWAMLIMSLAGHFEAMAACNTQFSSDQYQLFTLTLPPEAQKTLIHFIRQQMDIVDDNYFYMAGIRTESRKAWAIANALICLDNRYNSNKADAADPKDIRDGENLTFTERCASGIKQRAIVNNEKAYRIAHALFAIHKSLVLLNCSQLMNPISKQDLEAQEDAKKIRRFLKDYTAFDEQLTDTHLHLVYLLKSFNL